MPIENGLDLEKEAQNFHFPEETKRREDELSAAGKREDESANPDYEIFIDPEKRKEVFEYSKALSEYLKSQSISDLVLIDRSIRPMYIGVMEYWKAKYPKEKMPNIFFVNPKGFKAEGDLTEEQIDNMSFASAFKEDDYESKKLRPKEQIEKEFQETYQQLLEDKDKSVMIFDTCSHTGDSIAPVKEMFDKNGFKDLKIGTINRPDDESKIKADFSINDKDHHEYGEENCYPFFLDLMIQKTFDHVYSKVSDDPNHRKIATLLRREIKRVMKEELKNEEQVAEKAEEAGEYEINTDREKPEDEIDPELVKIGRKVLGEEGFEAAKEEAKDKVLEAGRKSLGQQVFEKEETQKELQGHEDYLNEAKRIFEGKREMMEKSGNRSLEDLARNTAYRIKEAEDLLSEMKAEKNTLYGYKLDEYIRSLKGNIGYIEELDLSGVTEEEKVSTEDGIKEGIENPKK